MMAVPDADAAIVTKSGIHKTGRVGKQRNMATCRHIGHL